jgi:penicillin-binding protein A
MRRRHSLVRPSLSLPLSRLMAALPVLTICSVWLLQCKSASSSPNGGGPQPEEISLAKRIFRPTVETDPAALGSLPGADMTQLNLTQVQYDAEGTYVALPEKATARLTLHPKLQKTAQALLAEYKIPEASLVVMDVATGHILAYASHVEGKAQRDLNVEATAPAASVFKMVTASALVEAGAANLEQEHCYSGGENKLNERDLEADPVRDKYCVTLPQAMGRSINTVFARLALGKLNKEKLAHAGEGFSFGRAVPFDVPVQPSTLSIPEDGLNFARTAAGFWHSTLSPVHATWMSAAIARGGESIRPVIVSEVRTGSGKKIYAVAESKAGPRVVSEKAALALRTMLEQTVSDGTCFKAFHDRAKSSFLPGITVAGKTGTLTDASAQKFYTWFTGFAPSQPVDGVRQIAVAALAANGAVWKVKGNVIAREMLRAAFAEQGAKGVTYPLGNIGRDERDKEAAPKGRAAR